MPTNSANPMGIPIPSVSTQPGTQYATDVNQCLGMIAGHTHGPGSGVPIGTAGISIQSDLSFNINNAVAVRTTRFTPTTATSGTDIGCVYVRGVDLFYNDLLGNVVPITRNGGLSTTALFSGLISTTALLSANGTPIASSGFIRMLNNSDFVSWRNAGNNADNNVYFDANDDFVIRGGGDTGARAFNFKFEDQTNNKVVKAQAQIGSSAYTLGLPIQPSTSPAVLFLSPAGAMVSTSAITRAQLPTLGQQISSSGTFTTTSLSFVNVTYLTVTITTTGRPVRIEYVPANNGNPATWNYGRQTETASGQFRTLRNDVDLGQMTLGNTNSGSGATLTQAFGWPPAVVDFAPSSTFTYIAQMKNASSANSGSGAADHFRMLAYEI